MIIIYFPKQIKSKIWFKEHKAHLKLNQEEKNQVKLKNIFIQIILFQIKLSR